MVWNRTLLLLAVVYAASLLLVGMLAGRKKRDANQFLNATGALPLWLCIAACIAANCGSLDVIAMMALGAQYGILACHFYWIGAVPALLVLVFWLLPAYTQGRYPSILDFIARHYGSQTRSMVALCMAAMMLLLAGVCLCAVAQVMVTFLGLSFLDGVLLTAPVVLLYSWAGGFRATVYTELLHFAVVLMATVPVFFLVVHDFGGLARLRASIPAGRVHLWQTLPVFAPQATMDRVGLILGLGIVLSFGYWSTDFVQMQRALAVRRPQDVRFVPLSLAAAKIIFAFLIVLPGVVAPLVLHAGGAGNWNATLPSMMLHYYSPSWAALGVMGLIACLVSTFANNVAGFSSAWIQGIYRPWIRPRATEAHYVWMSRATSASAVVLSIGAAYVALRYQSLMDYMQMIFSTFNAPLFAVVALAALAPRKVAGGGLGGFTLGLIGTILHQVLVRTGILHYGSQMSANFYAAILGFSVAAATTLLLGRMHRQRQLVTGGDVVHVPIRFPLPTVMLALGIAAACVAINLLFW
jgi:SSS family solute:Na+ symporter